MKLQEITPSLILAFLDHLEHDRGSSVRSRNARLAALRAFLKFAGRRDVTALHVVEQALGVPMKRFERPMLGFLTRDEMMAVIGKPGTSWTSQRDHLLLRVFYNTGARVSEIIGVQLRDVVLDGAPCVHLHGKGRKQRTVPLWRSTVRQLRAWLRLPAAAARLAAAAQPRWTIDAAAMWAAARWRSRLPAAMRAPIKRRISPHTSATHRHAPAAIWHGSRDARAVAWAREPDDYPPLR
jgi:site-specific recombinase XerD